MELDCQIAMNAFVQVIFLVDLSRFLVIANPLCNQH